MRRTSPSYPYEEQMGYPMEGPVLQVDFDAAGPWFWKMP
tara:strand:+ start:113 stop:229 length:117 start_codon:yes stop_codon:yes gene_type:complete